MNVGAHTYTIAWTWANDAHYHASQTRGRKACKKRKGGRHFQLPGGHVDAHELEQYGDAEGSRIAAARELHEETGIDFRDRLYRYSRCTPRAASLAPRAACVRRGGHCVFLCLSCYCCVERKEACFSWSARRRVSPSRLLTRFLPAYYHYHYPHY